VNNPHDRGGGSFVVQPDGTVDRAGGTVPHPEGDAPRTADGTIIRDGVILDGTPPPPPAPKPLKPGKKEA
jgi:hypothetical protein